MSNTRADFVFSLCHVAQSLEAAWLSIIASATFDQISMSGDSTCIIAVFSLVDVQAIEAVSQNTPRIHRASILYDLGA